MHADNYHGPERQWQLLQTLGKLWGGVASGSRAMTWKDKPQQGEVAQGTHCASREVTRDFQARVSHSVLQSTGMALVVNGHYRKGQVAEAEQINGWQMMKAGLLAVAVGGYRETREGG